MATTPVTLVAVPVVFWLRIGKSAGIAIVKAPLAVVDFRRPVAREEVPGA